MTREQRKQHLETANVAVNGVFDKLMEKFKEMKDYDAWQVVYDFKKHWNENLHKI